MHSFVISLRNRIGSLLRNSPWAIAAELLIVGLVRVFRVYGPLRLATICFLVMGSLSLWLRQSSWRQIGLRRPASWLRTVVLGTGIAVVWTALDLVVTLPLLERLTGQSLELSEYASVQGNLGSLLLWVALSWTLAAFGEEMAYRGYMLNRLADLFGRDKAGWACSLIIMGLAFGAGHTFQGPVGFVLSAEEGVLFGILYLASGRNLWLTVIGHGVGNTIGFIMLYFGLNP